MVSVDNKLDKLEVKLTMIMKKLDIAQEQVRSLS